MIKNLTCIECPNGCQLTIEIEQGNVLKVSGNKCDKGKDYGISEIENPVRILTSSVLAEGLNLKMIPVRTDKAIPKSSVIEAMNIIKKLKISKKTKIGDIIFEDLLGLKINLIATRDAKPL